MVNTLCQAAGTATISTTGTVQYWKIAGRVITNTTETNTQIIFRSAGTFSHFLMTLTGNTIASTTTIRFRVNAEM